MEHVIVDHRGNPLRKEELRREVAAPSLTGIRNAWSVESVSSSITPARLADLLMNAANGEHRDYLVLAEEMEERDLHYGSVLGTRKRAISGLDIVVEAASEDSNDVKMADAVRDLTRNPDFGEMIDDALDALGKGYSSTEIMWDTSEKQWQPARYEFRDPRFFMYDRPTGRELMLIDDGNIDGVALPSFKFIVHHPRIKSGLPVRGGLARLACVGYMCKAYAIKDWMAFAEVFGMPLRLGRYGPSASSDDIETLISAVANIGSDAAAVFPDSMRIEFEQAGNGAGGEKLFLGLAEWWDKQISKGVLGQTMTADDGSSQAQANVHNDVRGDILVADAKALGNTLNRDLVRPFIDLNYGPQKRYPQIVLRITEPEDMDALTNALEKLVPLGLKVDASEVRDKFGLSDPTNKKDVKLLQAPAASLPTTLESANNHQHGCPSCGHAHALNSQHNNDAIDVLVDVALDDWQPQMKPIIDPVTQLAESSESYEEFLAGLPGLLDDEMDSGELIKRLALETFKARGMGDATDEL